MNHWVGIGRLVRDPNVKYTQSGKTYASFTLAIDRRKSGDGKQQADFIQCGAWEKLAEVISQYVAERQSDSIINVTKERRLQKQKSFIRQIFCAMLILFNGK